MEHQWTHSAAIDTLLGQGNVLIVGKFPKGDRDMKTTGKVVLLIVLIYLLKRLIEDRQVDKEFIADFKLDYGTDDGYIDWERVYYEAKPHPELSDYCGGYDGRGRETNT